MKRRLLLNFAVVAAVMALSATARADTFTFTGINTGVTGTVNITQLSDNLLTVTLTNTSTGAVTGKITSIGFNLPGSGGGSFTLVSATNPNYRLETGVGGSAGGIATTFELALLTGPSFDGAVIPIAVLSRARVLRSQSPGISPASVSNCSRREYSFAFRM
ncbi:MAG TPA: hypothetical protein VF899_07720 [Pyrinomonadaceae bacterium]